MNTKKWLMMVFVKTKADKWAENPDFAKGYDGAGQIREMAKLGGKLVL